MFFLIKREEEIMINLVMQLLKVHKEGEVFQILISQVLFQIFLAQIFLTTFLMTLVGVDEEVEVDPQIFEEQI